MSPARHPLPLLALLAALTACGDTAPVVRPAGSPAMAARPTTRETVELSSYASIDEYKSLVAGEIVVANRAATFTGKLPPMLPAIVVLRITVDKEGRLVEVIVQRSRDDAASKVALASFKPGMKFPKPLNLVPRREKTLTFSETFLFNDQYRFQLRTLAGPQ